ncbi:hypothetical protein [Sphingopyxis sp. JAI108]|uniref:hypothetical protein n=1 Tax=Sphingopyxis sp. JAI108 TaxID=2723060 RepID=UPI0015CBF69C|nr:hypothetical protein [Sphingopyxis sp. JAI108]NYF32232.1 hypothetical protein [Sphingopyxis sp. JAI108]
MKIIAFVIAAGLVVSGGAAAAESTSRPSEYRPGLSVESIYKQDLDGVYFTEWFGRVEASEGSWRDVYFETSDKYVNKGRIRFDCADPEADIAFTLYGVGEYGKATDDMRQVDIPYGDRKAWADGNYQPMFGETPPIEFYGAARERFCK